MTKNKTSTRFASETQEQRIAKKFDGNVQLNSGAGKFSKGDVIIPDIGMQIECKTCMTPKESFSIKKEWLEKQIQESFAMRYSNHSLAFNFYFEDKKDYYIIDDKLMQFLIEKLREENNS